MKSMAALLAGFVMSVSAQGAGKAPIQPASFYEDNPTYTDKVNDDASWILSSPESVGLDSKLLKKAGDAFGKKSASFSMLVVRKNVLAYERYFHGTTKSSSNNIHSASKSIVGAAIGIAIEKGFIRSLDQPIEDFLPQARGDITIRHLLTHSSGMKWTEDSTEYKIEKKPNWVDAILALQYPDKPGSKWNYSTGNTHLLSAILTKATGQSLAAFARAEIFSKIGIMDERWGQDPQRISSGGYNVYLTAREMAKFGLLYLNGGVAKGKQVVPAHWVDDSFRRHISPRPGSEYGLLFWQRNIAGHEVKFAWGYGGQLIYVVPSLDMVVVFATNTRGTDPNFEGDELLAKYIFSGTR